MEESEASRSTDSKSSNYLTRNGKFPQLSIELCKKAVQNCREFRWIEKEDLLIINYDFCFGETFPDPEIQTDPELALLYRVRR